MGNNREHSGKSRLLLVKLLVGVTYRYRLQLQAEDKSFRLWRNLNRVKPGALRFPRKAIHRCSCIFHRVTTSTYTGILEIWVFSHRTKLPKKGNVLGWNAFLNNSKTWSTKSRLVFALDPSSSADLENEASTVRLKVQINKLRFSLWLAILLFLFSLKVRNIKSDGDTEMDVAQCIYINIVALPKICSHLNIDIKLRLFCTNVLSLLGG